MTGEKNMKETMVIMITKKIFTIKLKLFWYLFSPFIIALYLILLETANC